MTNARLVSADRREDDVAEASLRPQKLAEFIGQEKARANLDVFIKAARGAQRSTRSCAVRGPARASARPRWRRSWRANSG